jgi:ribonuclease BN (tRNA processing enzyme)
MQIRVLGCSGGIGPELRTTSLLIDGETLIDAGTGVGDLTLDEMARIRRVFLSHSHLDHVCGLAFMADNLVGDVPQIEVLSMRETVATLRAHLFNWQLWPDFAALPTVEAPLLRFNESSPGQRHELGRGRSVQSFRVLHSIPAVGYALCSASGAVFAFTGDTGASAEMWADLNALPRLDYLMIDIAFPDEQAELGVVSCHYTPGLLGRELGQLRHRPELLLTHHKPGCEPLLEVQCARALSGWKYRHLKRGTLIDL